jgi:lactate dehydrogenase-like 2-hydroxyacid dehydrogenase
VHKANARFRDQNFALSGLLGQNLSGKTVGVVGTGRIGKKKKFSSKKNVCETEI